MADTSWKVGDNYPQITFEFFQYLEEGGDSAKYTDKKYYNATIKYIIRDHSAQSFAKRCDLARQIEKKINAAYGDGTVVLLHVIHQLFHLAADHQLGNAGRDGGIGQKVLAETLGEGKSVAGKYFFVIESAGHIRMPPCVFGWIRKRTAADGWTKREVVRRGSGRHGSKD